MSGSSAPSRWPGPPRSRFLAATDTTAFPIVRGDTLLYEGRDVGYPHWPELLSDLARRLDESTTDTAS